MSAPTLVSIRTLTESAVGGKHPSTIVNHPPHAAAFGAVQLGADTHAVIGLDYKYWYRASGGTGGCTCMEGCTGQARGSGAHSGRPRLLQAVPNSGRQRGRVALACGTRNRSRRHRVVRRHTLLLSIPQACVFAAAPMLHMAPCSAMTGSGPASAGTSCRRPSARAAVLARALASRRIWMSSATQRAAIRNVQHASTAGIVPAAGRMGAQNACDADHDGGDARRAAAAVVVRHRGKSSRAGGPICRLVTW